MSIKTHPNWQRFWEDSIEYIFFEDQQTLYKIEVPRDFECKMRKISIVKARELLDKMPPPDLDDGDKFYDSWNQAMGDPIPMLHCEIIL